MADLVTTYLDLDEIIKISKAKSTWESKRAIKRSDKNLTLAVAFSIKLSTFIIQIRLIYLSLQV